MSQRGDRSVITTPMHPTVERLFDEYSRLSAVGDRQRSSPAIGDPKPALKQQTVKR